MTPYIVYGGPSSENEVSQESKNLFVEILQKYSPMLVEWKKDFHFVIQSEKEELDLDEFIQYLQSKNGLFVNAMHGEFCEDGWIQERLEKAGILFTGPSSASARLSMDKIAAQEIVKDLVTVIPTTTFVIPEDGSRKYELLEKSLNFELGFPLFLKPNAKGSSVGIYKIHDQKEMEEVVDKLEPDTYLLQLAITGTEISIGAVCDEGKFLDLPATEILPKGEFFDYDSKYSEGGSNEITPARISKEAMEEVKRISIEVHKRLDLGCDSRTDLIISKDNKFYYLETNSLPGMSKMSLLPQQLRNIGKLEEFGDILLRNINKPS
jgi:D-alanine-D-alanine ligase